MNYNDSMPRSKRCSVSGKICYSKKMGETFVNESLQERGVELKLYWCGYCDYWHLTHQIVSKKYFKKRKRK